MERDGIFWVEDIDPLKCAICEMPLIEVEKLEKLRQASRGAPQSIFSMFGFGDDLDEEDVEIEDDGKKIRIKHLVLYRCGHRFHRSCLAKKQAELDGQNNEDGFEDEDEIQITANMYMPKKHEYPTRRIGRKKRGGSIERRPSVVVPENLGKCPICGKFDFMDKLIK